MAKDGAESMHDVVRPWKGGFDTEELGKELLEKI